MIQEEVKQRFEKALKEDGKKVWAGVNQTMRKVDNDAAEIILIAEDVTPVELIRPLEVAAKERGIEHYYATKEEIAKIVGCPRPASAACLTK